MWLARRIWPGGPGPAQDALFERLHGLSAVGSQIAAELGPAPGEIRDFADSVPTISHLSAQPPVGELWYDDPRTDTKAFLAERHWEVTGVDLVETAASEYGRAFHELPTVFDRLLRSKFFSAIRKG